MGLFSDLFDEIVGNKCGKNLRWELDNGTLTISGTGEMKIPFFVQEIPWYDKRKSIRRILIEDAVTTIDKHAFVGCENLMRVTIGNSVTKIDSHAFAGCTNLTSVTIPDSVTTIGYRAFDRCENLTSVMIPESVTTIEDYAFVDCTSLKEIHYPAGRGFEKVLSQGNNAKLIPYTVAPPGNKPTVQPANELKFYPVQPTKPVAEKLTWKFEGKTLTVGGVRVIENFPYAQIPWIDHLRKTQKIVITDGVEEIAAYAFSECTSLELIELPASLKTIGDMAFSCSYCGERFVNGGKNVFWSLEDGVLVLKKNPDAPPAADFFTGSVSWIFAEKNIRSVKFEDGVKPTEKFFSWLAQRFDGKEISFK